MNYYSFHVGDYRGATAHLRDDEDLCYRRLLDLYYDKDGELPDLKTISRRVRFSDEIVIFILLCRGILYLHFNVLVYLYLIGFLSFRYI